jgi:hypothetical protein
VEWHCGNIGSAAARLGTLIGFGPGSYFLHAIGKDD